MRKESLRWITNKGYFDSMVKAIKSPWFKIVVLVAMIGNFAGCKGPIDLGEGYADFVQDSVALAGIVDDLQRRFVPGLVESKSRSLVFVAPDLEYLGGRRLFDSLIWEQMQAIDVKEVRLYRVAHDGGYRVSMLAKHRGLSVLYYEYYDSLYVEGRVTKPDYLFMSIDSNWAVVVEDGL